MRLRWPIPPSRRMTRGRLIQEGLTHSIIGAFFEVYRSLGFGFLEHVYVMALERELLKRKHVVGREVTVQIMYKGEALCTQRLDMVVDEKVVVEIKATYELHPASQRQLYNYLRATNLEVGLLLHFGREPEFYRLMCRNPSRSAARDLEHAHLPAPERPNGDVGADSPVRFDEQPRGG